MPQSRLLERRRLLASGAALGLSGRSHGVWAQQPAWPSRPVKMVVGSPPGGPSDFLGRMMADGVGPGFGQAFVIENKPGASGVPAAESVVRAPADGHTLLVTGPASIVVNPQLIKAPYDPINDLTPVCCLGAGAFVLAVHPSVQASNLQELIALAKSKPGALNYGSGGNGSSGHLATELFSSLTGTRMTHVPYKGDGQAVGDLISGQVQLMFSAPNVLLPHVKTGKLRLIAVTTRERVASLPDAPTLHEQGVKDFEYLGWIIVFAPAATPRPIIEQLSAAWAKAKTAQAVRDRLHSLAMSPPDRLSTPAALADFVKTEYARLGKVIKEANVTV